jgi:hypothetical protein
MKSLSKNNLHWCGAESKKYSKLVTLVWGLTGIINDTDRR